MEYYIKETFSSDRVELEKIINTEIAAGAKIINIWSSQINLVQILFSRKIAK